MTDAPDMPVTAIAPWFGGKRNLAPEIIAEVGPHRSWWEPMCGSLAVTLAKPAASFETVSDLHGDLANLVRVLRDESSAVDLYARLIRTIMHESLFTEAAERFKARGHAPADDLPDIQRAEDFMVASWFGRNGMAGTDSHNQGFCVRYTANGGHGATRWRSVTASIPAWHARLRNVTMYNRCAFELLPRIEDAASTAIYLDPPYIENGCRYVHAIEKPCAACERIHTHAELAELLRRFKLSRVIVSYYAHPDLDALYPNWTRREFEVSKATAHQVQRQKSDVRATEVLLINGPSLAAQRGLFGGATA